MNIDISSQIRKAAPKLKTWRAWASSVTTFMLCMSLSPMVAAEDKAADTTEAIGAQLNVTHGYIDQLVRQLGQRSPQRGFNLNDYKVIAPEFKRQIEMGLEAFESALENSVMRKLSFWMDRYNKIYSSPEFSADQKETLLVKQYEIILKQAKMISKEYQQELFKAYKLAGNLPNDIAFTRFDTGAPLPTPVSVGKTSKKKAPANRDSTPVIRLTLLAMDGSPLESTFTADDYLTWPQVFDAEIPCANRVARVTPSDVSGDHVTSWGSSHTCELNQRVLTESTPTQTISNPAFFEPGIVIYPYNRENPQHVHGKMGQFLFTARNNKTKALDIPNAVQKKGMKVIYPIVSAGCRSQLCVGLRAADITFFIDMVKQSLDRVITVKLLDGRPVSLDNLNYDIELTGKFLGLTDYPPNLDFDTP